MSKPGSYCCKIDLKSAYRSVGLNPSQFHLCGLSWTFAGSEDKTYMVDTHLMMGSRKAPSIFHRLSQAVKRAIEKLGFTVIVYLDDFLIIEDSHEQCLQGQITLIKLLHELGFNISWPKVESPNQIITFLGVVLNSRDMTISLPNDKTVNLIALLNDFKTMKRASGKQLQRLAGKLNWASHIVKCGRSYLRRILNVMAQLRMCHHKARLSEAFKADINWWLSILQSCTTKNILVNAPSVYVFTDACNSGGGFVCNGDWGYVNWELDFPLLSGYHINCKETIVAVLAARRWAHSWCGSKVNFYVDNVTARANISKGTSN